VAVLPRLPVTINGKVDYAALPAPDFAAAAGSRAPAGEREEQLCALFAEVLRLESVGAEDSFLALGGDSIMSMQLAARAGRAGLVLTVREVMQLQTPAALAAVARRGRRARGGGVGRAGRGGAGHAGAGGGGRPGRGA
jgi:nonribosomal peptide synthetase CepB